MNETPTTPGGRARWIRERVLGLSLEELVDALGRLPRRRWRGSRSSVLRYERDERVLHPDFARALSELSGYSLDWIYDGRGQNDRVLDALDRVRIALEAITDRYRVDPIEPDLRDYRRLDSPEGG